MNLMETQMRIVSTIMYTVLLALSPIPASGETVRIGFDDLERIALERSPRAALIEREYEISAAARDRLLSWSNPELAAELERVGKGDTEEREYVLLLEKEITTPWVASAERAAGNLRVESAARSSLSSRRALLAGIRRGYVRLRMLDEEISILEGFDEILSEASRISEARLREGAISGIEKRLVGLSLLGVRSRLTATKGERRAVLAGWKETMGIAPEDTVVLETPIDITPAGSPALDIESLAGGMESTAALESARLGVEALQRDVAARRGGVLPSISIGGGYKNAGDDMDGFVIGVSMPLPLLNRGSGAIDEAEARLAAARRRYELLERSRRRRIEQAAATVSDRLETLDLFGGYVEGREGQTRDIVLSYREGWMSFGGLLEGIRLYNDSIETYFDILEQYHDAVFELEELTERYLYEPAPAGGKDQR